VAASAVASIETAAVDSNTAFFEGVSYSYVMPAPRGFVLNTVESTDDGYSFAFLIKGLEYAESPALIGVNLFSIVDSSGQSMVASLIEADTLALRNHFGNSIAINPVEGIAAHTGQLLPTFYLHAPERFIPNVMTAYFDGTEELVVFELTIAEGYPRFKAEESFLECIRKFRALIKKKIDLSESGQ
jgi:hypothetical protein